MDEIEQNIVKELAKKILNSLRKKMPKFFVRADGSSVLQKRGDLTDKEINVIEKFIKLNYQDMYKTWKDFGGGDFFRK